MFRVSGTLFVTNNAGWRNAGCAGNASLPLFFLFGFAPIFLDYPTKPAWSITLVAQHHKDNAHKIMKLFFQIGYNQAETVMNIIQIWWFVAFSAPRFWVACRDDFNSRFVYRIEKKNFISVHQNPCNPLQFVIYLTDCPSFISLMHRKVKLPSGASRSMHQILINPRQYSL